MQFDYLLFALVACALLVVLCVYLGVKNLKMGQISGIAGSIFLLLTVGAFAAYSYDQGYKKVDAEVQQGLRLGWDSVMGSQEIPDLVRLNASLSPCPLEVVYKDGTSEAFKPGSNPSINDEVVTRMKAAGLRTDGCYFKE